MNTPHQFYATDHETLASRCLGLIERNAPKYMRLGGYGGLSIDGSEHYKRMTPETREQMEAKLRATNSTDHVRIGMECGGFSPSAVSRVWRAMKRKGVQ
jgi:hypothetical protein